MKQLILTGLAEETDLTNGETTYLLVFNKGHIRVPATEQMVREIIAYTASDAEGIPAQAVPASMQAEWAPAEQAPARPTFQVQRNGQLPKDHGAAQVPFVHTVPAAPAQPPRRQGDYAAPPPGAAVFGSDEPPPQEDDDGTQF